MEDLTVYTKAKFRPEKSRTPLQDDPKFPWRMNKHCFNYSERLLNFRMLVFPCRLNIHTKLHKLADRKRRNGKFSSLNRKIGTAV